MESTQEDMKNKERIAAIEKLLLENQPLSQIDDDNWLWMHTEGYAESSIIADSIPALPQGMRQFGYNGRSGEKNIVHGYSIYKLVRETAEEHIGPLESMDGILDFGCGWGRIIRFFRRDISPDKLWGVDAIKGSIWVCKNTLPGMNFRFVSPEPVWWSRNILTRKIGLFLESNFTDRPPSLLKEKSFNVIFANSVFSHLSEDVHLKWLNEFERLLKPGGIIVLTTWDKGVIRRCKKAREGTLENRSKERLERLREMFQNPQEAIDAYDSGAFCYDAGLSTQREGFGNACISKKYITSRWPRCWNIIDFIDDRKRYPQAVIVAQLKK